LFTKEFNTCELHQAINKLKNKKAPGPDQIHPEFIKHLGEKAKQKLLEFYNHVWKTNVPTE